MKKWKNTDKRGYMKTFTYNKYNLKDSEIDRVVVRIKVILENDSKEILLGYCDNKYQFPGGHIECNETFNDCLLREVKEETGIELESKEYSAFFSIKHYNKDYPKKNFNTLSEIYYFKINTNQRPNLKKVNYTNNEKSGLFELKYININDIKKVLKDNEIIYPKNRIMVKEMLSAIKEYKKIT
jgi:8-oxo-dGTP diphosphatase